MMPEGVWEKPTEAELEAWKKNGKPDPLQEKSQDLADAYNRVHYLQVGDLTDDTRRRLHSYGYLQGQAVIAQTMIRILQNDSLEDVASGVDSIVDEVLADIADFVSEAANEANPRT